MARRGGECRCPSPARLTLGGSRGRCRTAASSRLLADLMGVLPPPAIVITTGRHVVDPVEAPRPPAPARVIDAVARPG